MNSWLQMIKGANTCLHFARNLLPLFLEKWPLPTFCWPCTSLRCFLSLGIRSVLKLSQTGHARGLLWDCMFVAPVPRWESLLACPQTAMPRLRLAFPGGIVPIPTRVAHLLLVADHCLAEIFLEPTAFKRALYRST